MDILEQTFIKGFISLCNEGASHNWHERNGGNLSYRLKEEEITAIKDVIEFDREFKPIGTEVERLAGQYFLVTGSGRFFSNVKEDPENSIGIIQIDETGKNFRVVWGLINGGRPTSELPTHLMNHQAKLDKGHRVIYHCHPANVIALTFVLPINDRDFTLELWEAATECPVVFPDGVGVVRWMVPGGREIAVETSKLMEKYDVVIWTHHGLLCSGKDFDLTFGLAHTVEKAAEIAVKVRAMGGKKLQTITTDDFLELEKSFGVRLNKDILIRR